MSEPILEARILNGDEMVVSAKEAMKHVRLLITGMYPVKQRCSHYWGTHDALCVLDVDHKGEHMFPFTAAALNRSAEQGRK